MTENLTFLEGSTGSNDKLVVVWDLTGHVTAHTELFVPLLSSDVVECQMIENTQRASAECVLLEKVDNFESGVNSCCFYGKNLVATGSGLVSHTLFSIIIITSGTFQG